MRSPGLLDLSRRGQRKHPEERIAVAARRLPGALLAARQEVPGSTPFVSFVWGQSPLKKAQPRSLALLLSWTRQRWEPNVPLPCMYHLCACIGRKGNSLMPRMIEPVQGHLCRRRSCAFAEVAPLAAYGLVNPHDP